MSSRDTRLHTNWERDRRPLQAMQCRCLSASGFGLPLPELQLGWTWLVARGIKGQPGDMGWKPAPRSRTRRQGQTFGRKRAQFSGRLTPCPHGRCLALSSLHPLLEAALKGNEGLRLLLDGWWNGPKQACEMKAACWWSRCVSTRNLERTRIPRARRAALAATRSSARLVMSTVPKAATRMPSVGSATSRPTAGRLSIRKHGRGTQTSCQPVSLEPTALWIDMVRRAAAYKRSVSLVVGRTLHGLAVGARGTIGCLRLLPWALSGVRGESNVSLR
ncbi:hypothetical protein K491DRAFT_682580 [Lophiostoma macrostomum CBS 122681]|uniref:Uncharacterized protein n=1 Tax=Lophiostoma macrostomum CBS 122681 TaxID=1314788 RepID=A0A6A6ST82_9PLEO|nr:hypothetical protein K491DRAFT_682580 [Lophiostoma macrostomum CBS 122681]